MSDQSAIQEIGERAEKYMEEQGTSYVLYWYETRYTITRDGRLSSEWAGD